MSHLAKHLSTNRSLKCKASIHVSFYSTGENKYPKIRLIDKIRLQVKFDLIGWFSLLIIGTSFSGCHASYSNNSSYKCNLNFKQMHSNVIDSFFLLLVSSVCVFVYLFVRKSYLQLRLCLVNPPCLVFNRLKQFQSMVCQNKILVKSLYVCCRFVVFFFRFLSCVQYVNDLWD